MDRTWICLALFALAFGATKAQNDDSADAFDGYWYSDEAEKLGIVDPDETKHNIDVDMYDDLFVPSNGKDDVAVQAEIEKFRKDLGDWKEESEELTDLDEYQYEDNRSGDKDEHVVPEAYEKFDGDVAEDFPDNNDESLEPKYKEENEEEGKLYDASIPKEIFEEAQAILNEDSNENDFPNLETEEKSSLEGIIDETKQLLEEENSAFDELEPVKNIEDNDQEEVDEYNIAAAETKNEEPSVENNLDQLDDVDNYYDDPNEESFDKIVKQLQNEEIESFVEQNDEEKEIGKNSVINLDSNNPQSDEVKQQENDDQEINDGIPEVEDADILENEETVDKVYADLNEDLQKLFETWDKLSKDDSDEKVEDEVAEVDSDNVLAYEEKYGKPFREDSILKQRDDYDIVHESNQADSLESDTSLGDKADKLFDSAIADDVVIEKYNADKDDVNQENEYDDEQDDNVHVDDDQVGDDQVVVDQVGDDQVVVDQVGDEQVGDDDVDDDRDDDDLIEDDQDETDEDNDYQNDADQDTDIQNDAESGIRNLDDPKTEVKDTDNSKTVKDAEILKYMHALQFPDEDNDYQNDADQDTDIQNDAESGIRNLDDPKTEVKDTDNSKTVKDAEILKYMHALQFPEETSSVKTISVDDLSPSQYNNLVKQFVATNKQALDPQGEDFARDVAPIHMTLSLDEPLVVTSPNYPSAYPTNNIVDWIFEGEGMGIELNLTDFAVNGNIGDYLLVKPGGLDESGSEGLIFTYTLNEPRRYRFLDVDHMFVRFQANMGLGFMRGFQFSVKMVAPPIETQAESELEDPEALIPAPPATIAVNLGITSPANFTTIREPFRQLVADMATMYINAKETEQGLKNTSESTQITSASVCNINWPNYEQCVLVEFGVPLIFEDMETTRLTEEELKDMWNTYIYQDPFALRLRRMGVTEFEVPDDDQVLMVWLVIAAGAVISMAMLAFALWRYSCFEDYARMPPFSDTDSIRDEKRNLDLYPTPHQTLPPLYGDTDYKWDDGKYEDSTRVDMGGFTNRSYARDELLDLDSDDDVLSPPKERYTTDV